MPNADDVILAEVDKNAREVLRVTSTTYEGIALLDVRCWTKPTTPTADDGKPTKKGLSLRPGLWAQLLPVLQEALQADGGGGARGQAQP